MYSPFGHVAFWYAALAQPPGRAPRAYPFAAAGGAQDDERARRMARRLREQPPALRGPLLSALSGRASVLPWTALHPSWLEEVLEGCGPRWRPWALDVLPRPLRGRLQRDEAENSDEEGPARLEDRAPAWWASWFSSRVKARLRYPDLPPWERAAGAAGLPGTLWEREEGELIRLLALHGTRGLVSALRRLPREEAQRWIWQLPAECQPVANETIRRRHWLDDPFWPAILEALGPEFPELESRLFRMALADWARAGMQAGQELHLRRLAFRLPRHWGEWLLRQVESGPAWLSLPVQPDIETWRQRLQGLLEPAPAGAPRPS
jgi:hypothetical protein